MARVPRWRPPLGWLATGIGWLVVYGVVDGGRALAADTLRHPLLAVAVIAGACALWGML